MSVFTWSNILFLLSVDGIFLWSVSIALEDAAFSLIDPYFLIQLQFRIVGILILSWAFSVLLANFIRFVIMILPLGFSKRLIVRRVFRYCLAKFRLEILFLVFLAATSIVTDPLDILWVVGFYFSFKISIVLFFWFFPHVKLSSVYKRIRKKKAISNSVKEGSAQTIALLDKGIRRDAAVLTFLTRLVLVLLSIGLGSAFAEKLKSEEAYVIVTNTHELRGSIVGQTSYGFLVWTNDCDCLQAAGFGQIVVVKPVEVENE
jgi:hypothetical protein